MIKIYSILVLLLLTIQIKAQETKVEIYDVSGNTLITGVVTDSIGDSIYVQTDKSELIAFAKADMQGLEFGVTKEIKKLQRELFIDETNKLFPHYPGYPGKYQIKNGQIRKGRIMHLMATTGIICIAVGGIGFIISSQIVLGATIGLSFIVLNYWAPILVASIYTLGFGGLSYFPSFFWNGFDMYKILQSKVKNRYYYTGKNLKVKPV